MATGMADSLTLDGSTELISAGGGSIDPRPQLADRHAVGSAKHLDDSAASILATMSVNVTSGASEWPGMATDQPSAVAVSARVACAGTTLIGGSMPAPGVTAPALFESPAKPATITYEQLLPASGRAAWFGGHC